MKLVSWLKAIEVFIKLDHIWLQSLFYQIHSDVWGPSKIATLIGKKRFVTFIDDHTRLCWLYLMNSKNEVAKLFKVFYSLVENQFQAKISILQSDNGTKNFNEC